MLKGKATIQLFDSGTGELKKEVTNDNLVTKAIENLLNSPIEVLAATDTPPVFDVRASSSPMLTYAYGGLLLFSNTHDESIDNTYPGYDSDVVGYGSSAASSSTTKEGTFNTTESKWIDNDEGKHIGYRFVWDFTTSQSNGVIKSLSLTSVAGGSNGWVNETGAAFIDRKLSGDFTTATYKPGVSYIVPLGEGITSGSISGFASTFDTLKISWKSSLKILYISKEKDGIFYILASCVYDDCIYKIYFKTITNQSLFNNTATDTPEFVKYEKFISGIAERTGYYGWNSYVDDDEIHVFYSSATASHSSTSKSFNHIIFDLDTGTKQSEQTITSPISCMVCGIGYLKPESCYIALYNGNYYKFSNNGDTISNGTYSDLYSINSYNSVSFSKDHTTGIYFFINGGLMHQITKETVSKYGRIDNYTGGGSYYNSYNLVKNDYKSLPKGVIILSFFYRYSYVNVSIYTAGFAYATLAAYLGTINNLETPVTKTEAQTMKVVYELTESED